MEAVYINTYGGPDVLMHGEAPCPELKDDDVLIRAHAASVNPG